MGAGRLPQARGAISTAAVTSISFTTLTTNTYTTALSKENKVFAIGVTLSPATNPAYPSATAPILSVYIGEQLIVSYTLNPNAASTQSWRINDMIPVNSEIWNDNQQLRVTTYCTSDGGSQYLLNADIRAYLVTI